MRKIVIITQYFPPDMAGTGRVMQELAEDLVAAGHTLEVIAGTMNHFNRSGYQDYPNKISVRRVSHLRFNNNSKIGRLLNFISFPVSILIHLKAFKKADLVIMVSNPPTIVAIGALINKFLSKKVYYILQDIYPDLAIQLGFLSEQSLLARGMRFLNRWSFNYLEKIIVLTGPMNAYLARSYGLKSGLVTTITNWTDIEKIHPIPKDNPWSQVTGYADKFVILYTGNISPIYDLNLLIDAAEHLQSDPEVVFLIVGEGGSKDRLQELSRLKNLGNVDFMGYVAEEDYNKLLASADCLIVFQKAGLERFNFPGKVYDYLASGRPIIAVASAKGELAKLISSARAGVTVENSQEITNAIKQLKKDYHQRAIWGNNGRKYLVENFSRSQTTKRYLRLLNSRHNESVPAEFLFQPVKQKLR